ncbi:hypothetical protein HY546_01830 [archaeon]|nr:hypothetical protein [archaeon]
MTYMLRTPKVLIILSLIFLATEAAGLAVAQQYASQIDAGLLAPVVENPADPTNAGSIIAYILVITLAILVIIKFSKKLLLVLEALAVFFGSALALELLIPLDIGGVVSVGFLLAIALTAWKMLKPSILSQDVALVMSVAGAGAVLGVSLEPLPVFLLMLGLSVYDFLSVFVTKHMVYMARAITERPMAFTAAIPARFAKPVPKIDLKTGKKKLSKTHVFQLGGGDIAIPLVLASSLLRYFGAIYAIVSVAGAFLALLALFFFATKRPGRVLPALPVVSAGAVWSFALARLAGF